MVDMDLGEVVWFIKDGMSYWVLIGFVLIDIVETSEYEMICRQKKKE